MDLYYCPDKEERSYRSSSYPARSIQFLSWLSRPQICPHVTLRQRYLRHVPNTSDCHLHVTPISLQISTNGLWQQLPGFSRSCINLSWGSPFLCGSILSARVNRLLKNGSQGVRSPEATAQILFLSVFLQLRVVFSGGLSPTLFNLIPLFAGFQTHLQELTHSWNISGGSDWQTGEHLQRLLTNTLDLFVLEDWISQIRIGPDLGWHVHQWVFFYLNHKLEIYKCWNWL